MSAARIGDRSIASGGATYVLAEAGSNHNGELPLALELVDMAAAAGADGVKFQLFEAASLYPRNVGVVELPNGQHDFFEVLRELETPRGWLPDLIEAGRRHGIDVLFTPFDLAAVDLLAAHGAPAIKIASPELTHHPLLRHIGKAGATPILSTGMSTLGDIDEALGVLQDSGAPTPVVLHCTTAYPCPPEDANLSVVAQLATTFGVPSGLSDHTLDPVAAPLVTAAIGGVFVEKHVTLSRAMAGPDHSFAIEPDELVALVDAVRAIEGLEFDDRLHAAEAALGPDTVRLLRGRGDKRVVAAEAELADCDRRSLHATVAIEAGQPISEANVAVLRGERNLRPGLHPRYWDDIRGARTVRPVAAGDGLVWADLLDRRP